MSEAATETPHDPDVSTRTLAEVTQHRRGRVAEMLRRLAERIEHGDVERAIIGLDRKTGEVEPDADGNAQHAPTIGDADDLTVTLQLQLGRLHALETTADDTDPED